MRKFKDLELVKQVLKDAMPLDQLVMIVDSRLRGEGADIDELERVNDHLYKKRCDLDTHPVDSDGSRDSTASFTVCPQKELFYCFGCGGRGDRFEYISNKYHVDFMESVHMVAEIEGIDLGPYYADVSPEEQIRDNLFKENDMARDIAHQALLNNQNALNYLLGRGITMESIEMFKLGYAPPLVDGQTIFQSIPNQITLGLARKDQFNDAILFPITDVNGRMRYFQSRPFHPLSGMKYIGGSDTLPLFDATDRIFGFNISKKQMSRNGGKLVGVEGAPDAIACIQQDIATCGFLGTVVNQLTFDLLDKYRVTELTLLLDGDDAGRDRSYKICQSYMALKTNVRLKVATMPDGDPDEYINAHGADALREIINNAVYAVQYLIDAQWDNATTPTARIDFMSKVAPIMNAITDNAIKQIMITYVSGKLGLDPIQLEDYYTEAAAAQSGAKLCSPDGEEILLGEAMRNPDFMADLITKFSEDDWYLVRHKHLFRMLKSAQYTDVESLFVMAKNMNIDSVVTHDWLEYLHDKTGNIEFSMNDVEDKLMRRNALRILDNSRTMVTDMSQDIAYTLDKSTTDIFNTMNGRVDNQVYDMNKSVDSVMDLIHKRMEHPGEIIGLPFGDNFKKLEQATLGIQEKQFVVLAANQSVGKTQMSENWEIYQAVTKRIPTLRFSLEMGNELMTFRNLAILTGLNCQDIMTGNITMEQVKMIDEAAITLKNSPMYISEIGHDVTQALAIARRHINKFHVRLIYVDYIQLQYVSDKKINERHRELGTISKAWKQFAMETGVPVVALSQLSKEALVAKTAEAEHGAGSYEVAQDADVYITIKEKDQDEIDRRGIEHGNKTLNVSKNRMGQKEVLEDIYSDGPNYRMAEV